MAKARRWIKQQIKEHTARSVVVAGGFAATAIVAPLVVAQIQTRQFDSPRLIRMQNRLRVFDAADGRPQRLLVWVRNDGKQASSLRGLRLTVKDMRVVRCCPQACAPSHVRGPVRKGLPGALDPKRPAVTLQLSRTVEPGKAAKFGQPVREPDPRTHVGALYIYRVDVGLMHDRDRRPLSLGTAILTLPRAPRRSDILPPDAFANDPLASDCYGKNWAALDHMLAGRTDQAKEVQRFERRMRRWDRHLGRPPGDGSPL